MNAKKDDPSDSNELKELLKNWSDETSLEYILEESEKLLIESVNVVRLTINRSFAVAGFYFAFTTFWADKYISNGRDVNYIIMMCGGIISILIISPTIKHQTLRLTGRDPYQTLKKYRGFDKSGLLLERLKREKIYSNQKGIEKNLTTNYAMQQTLIQSLFGITLAVGAYIVSLLFLSTKAPCICP